jgi:hypothetical protein
MEGVFLTYLFGTGKNCATFGLGGSKCDVVMKDDPTINFRKPSLMPHEACSIMLEGLDRDSPPITFWQQLYRWLGRGNGWAYFTADSATNYCHTGLSKLNTSASKTWLTDTDLGHSSIWMRLVMENHNY